MALHIYVYIYIYSVVKEDAFSVGSTNCRFFRNTAAIADVVRSPLLAGIVCFSSFAVHVLGYKALRRFVHDMFFALMSLFVT